MREDRPLVAGVEHSPFVRLALVADYVNPFANSGDRGLGFINADLTIYAFRMPVDEWIGLEVDDHGSSDGLALGACRIFDRVGPVAHAVVCAVANRGMSTG
jgi:hypothetical protein